MTLPDDLPRRLLQQLSQPLPGRTTQQSWSPPLSYGRHFGPAAHDARHAAVCLLLYPHDGQWLLPLTLRPPHLAAHAGQISLPGGVVEKGESSQAAALRELHEELGVSHEGLSILGRLSELYLFNSNYVVTPWVVVREARPELAPNSGEVAQVWEVPLATMLADQARGSHAICRGGLEFTTPHLAWRGGPIWGATCMILAEFVAIVLAAAN